MNPSPTDVDLSGDPLVGLREYRLPDAVAWWPPAPGWWALLALSLILMGVFLWWYRRRRRCHAAARQANRELAQLRGRLSRDCDTAAFVRGVSRLLRRYALTAFPGKAAAALTGDEWLRFLDAHGGEGRFREGPGRHLIEAPYRPAADIPADQLTELVRDWIRSNRGLCQ